MSDDFRQTIIGCAAAMCRYNVSTSAERTCLLKAVSLDETGRCRNAEARPLPPPDQQTITQDKPAGDRFDGGRWVQ